ncbi:hypothetical protein LY78DRAFT_651995 [Colletotrichum sublineola]|nr:hypothetical protein LY78DRAFT_651995 [Colletotrichum sublineola]
MQIWRMLLFFFFSFFFLCSPGSFVALGADTDESTRAENALMSEVLQCHDGTASCLACQHKVR